MATWEQFTQAEPEFAAAVWARFAATKHHVIATVRRDGSPRVSGTEVRVVGPHLTIGSMLNAMKAVDLSRDGRFALHANPGDGSMDGGDAKLAGTATEIADPQLKKAIVDDMEEDPGPFHLFLLDVTEAVLTSLAPTNDALLIQVWRPGEGVKEHRR